MTPFLLLILVVSIAAFAVISVGFTDTRTEPDPPAAAPCVGECVPVAQYRAVRRLAAKRLAGWNRANKKLLRLRRVLRHSESFNEAIGLAIAVYGHPEIRRKCLCESHGNRYAHNASGASGICQFLPSTFASTPFHGFSIYSMYANALAAGWMHAHGRGGEWVCQ